MRYVSWQRVLAMVPEVWMGQQPAETMEHSMAQGSGYQSENQPMKQHRFFVTGDPKGQPRPRAFAFRGKVRVYDPGSAEGWKAQVALAAREAGLTALNGPVEVRIMFHFARPKSHFNKSGLKPSAPVNWHTQKPDADNLAKAVLDALTTLGAWKDDAYVARLDVAKVWALTGGAEILISELCD